MQQYRYDEADSLKQQISHDRYDNRQAKASLSNKQRGRTRQQIQHNIVTTRLQSHRIKDATSGISHNMRDNRHSNTDMMKPILLITDVHKKAATADPYPRREGRLIQKAMSTTE